VHRRRGQGAGRCDAPEGTICQSAFIQQNVSKIACSGEFAALTARKNCGFEKKLSDLTGKSNNFYGSRKKNLCFAFGLFGIILPTADIPLNNLLQPL
jgi:hypothetical protein